MKIVTFNVCALSGDRINKVIALFKELNPHIIFLQEISKRVLEKVAINLKYNSYWVKAGFLGNGLLTRYTICENESIQLDIGTVCETRSAIKATITPFGKIKFIGTHLDHLQENHRLQQLHLLLAHAQEVDFILGDLNSIHVQDYTPDELNAINKERRIGEIEEVRGDVLDQLKSEDYVVNPYVHWTSRFKTRIDFILHKRASVWKINEQVSNTILNHYSDHCLVLVTATK